jgi:PEGA domain-containing protein
MAPADERPGLVSPMRAATSALGSTSLLMAAIAIVSALGSFGAVRAWFPGVRAASTPPSTVTLTSDTAAPPRSDIELQRNVAPPSAAGRLSIVTDPAGARVEVDGRPQGKSPVVIEGLTASEHRIAVTSDGGSAERTIAVANGVMTELVFSLPRSTAPGSTAGSTAPVAGWVAVASPFPVDVIEHNEVVGTSGTTKIMLAAGKHEIMLRNESLGYETPRTITVAPGRIVALEVDPPKGLLNVNARPWADVLIDGETVGQTPLSNLALPVGSHRITFRHPQLGERTEQFVVTTRGVNRVAVDLNK